MKSLKRNWYIPVLMLLTAVSITVTGILYKQDFWRIIPLYVSLAVALLQSRVSRMSYLLGGLNSILYAVVYFSYGLYASAGYALLFSFPLQIVTFLNWSKNRSGKTTLLRKLPGKARWLILSGLVLAWLVLYPLTARTGSEYFALDNAVTLLGILNSILSMLRYMEYTFLMLPGGLLSIALYITMLPKNPEQITYLVFTVYSLICSTVALFTVLKQFKKEKAHHETQL